jgi:hypothetical protein
MEMGRWEDGKRIMSSFAYSLLSIFHEPGKYLETLSIIKNTLHVCFIKGASSFWRSTSMRRLYQKLGKSDIWARYIATLREQHRNLPALKDELARAKL